MTKKGYRIEEGRIQEIQKELGRIKTFQGLKKFLINELELTQECINEGDIRDLERKQEATRRKIFKELDKKWDNSQKNSKASKK